LFKKTYNKHLPFIKKNWEGNPVDIKNKYVNLDGVLDYPGMDISTGGYYTYTRTNYGVKGVFAGIRMKLIRRGTQDTDYLKLAENESSKATIDTVVDGIDTVVDSVLAHQHSAAKVYPTLATGKELICSATPWALGNFVEVVPASTITSAFCVVGINYESSTEETSETYEIVLFYGESDTECARARVSSDGTGSYIPVSTPSIAANSKIRAKAAGAAGSNSIYISIAYVVHA
jgi:hypothetical protein